jgi:hypothetical protein
MGSLLFLDGKRLRRPGAAAVCVGWAECLGGVCVAGLALGATCSATTSGVPTCSGAALCVDSVCTVPQTTPCP